MAATRTATRPRTPSTARHHAEWLSLIETSGPFLSMPVLQRVFPQGLDAHDPEHLGSLRLAFAEWEADGEDPAIHNAWVRLVFGETLEMPDDTVAEGQSLPPSLEARIAEHGETLRPDLAVVDPDDLGKARLLVQIYPPGQDLEKPVEGLRWKASPATRMTELLHASDVRLGLATNGEQWMLVHAPRNETTGYASWYASLWLEEHITLRAFRSLLSARRFFGVADEDTLEALFAESAQNQQEVTEQLGYQVRQAVEVLVSAIDRVDQDRNRILLAGADEKQLYEAALTVMMRLVFLFSAEERGLLLLGDPLYDQYYAVSTLREQLREDADQHGEEVLERRHDAYSRLLATFRAVHGGVEHEAMRLPAYGGTLFDPDRYPFLEGRASGTSWRDHPAVPLPIHNRDVLHLLEALQVLRVKVPGGGPAEARRLSFRALDIEQIGHVYEGLLDHTAVRATETVLGLTGSKDKEPEVSLSTLEELRDRGEAALLDFLKKETGRSSLPALRKALAAPPEDEARWRVAFENDEALAERARPFAGLVRDDMSGYPVVVLAGSVYVTKGSDRRESGTHYTPRSLTEPIVQHTLDPLVYEGPAEGWPKEEWRLRSAGEILALTVCDMAMGSGAFLVQACRYLSERLVEAWEEAGADRVPDDSPLPTEADEKLALARRLVADQCLYGVDKNPLAVEMGKLSLWLITLQKDRPFTFLDHAFRCGDSLLGVTSPDQLTHWSLDPEGTRNVPWFTLSTERALHAALDLRRQLHSFPVLSVRDAEAKARLLREAEEAMAVVRLGADLLVAAALRPAKRREAMSGSLLSEFHMQALAYEELREGAFTGEGEEEIRKGFAELRVKANELLGGRRPFHWPLEFPEVFVETEEPAIVDGRLPMGAGELLAELSKPREEFVSGFAAIVGNPPFQGGKKISGSLGSDYREHLVEYVANGTKGNADLCAYFFLRARDILEDGGGMGLLGTNTIAQGDTHEVGLDQIGSASCVVTRAISSRRWPGGANLEVALLWLRHGDWAGVHLLDDRPVAGITTRLTVPAAVQGEPYLLKRDADKAFLGSYIMGMGFTLQPNVAQSLIDKDIRNRDVLFPYLTGQDLNLDLEQAPSRWVINFRSWPLRRGAEGVWNEASTRQRNEWLRSGLVPEDYPEPVAADYPDCLRIVERQVKPERELQNDQGGKRYWWRFLRPRTELYDTLKRLERVLVTTRVTSFHFMCFVDSRIVFSDRLTVLTFNSSIQFAVLSSTVHDIWAHRPGITTHVAAPTYNPEQAFKTFPFPVDRSGLEDIGERYYAHRQRIMQSRQEGLTKTYNRFHDPDETEEDIERLRELHVEMDLAVADAYGWSDLALGHSFHETKQGVRYTISEEARREVLDRLLLLNHERYAQEVEQGLHDKKAKKGKAKKRTKPKVDGGTTSFFGEDA